MSRLTIDMTDSQHQSLKALASLQGKTIKQYAVERLFPAEGEDTNDWTDDEKAAWAKLGALLGKRVDAALSDPSSWRSFDEVWPDDGSMDRAA